MIKKFIQKKNRYHNFKVSDKNKCVTLSESKKKKNLNDVTNVFLKMAGPLYEVIKIYLYFSSILRYKDWLICIGLTGFWVFK